MGTPKMHSIRVGPRTACRCATGACPAEAGHTSRLLPLLGLAGLSTVTYLT